MTQQRTLKVERLGLVEYGAALEIQKQTERAVLTGSQPDTLLLLEHPHTLTLGRRSAQNGIMAPEEILKARGVSIFETNRGGKVTYHGLGQIVGYPIINLSPNREDVVSRACPRTGIPMGRREQAPVQPGRPFVGRRLVAEVSHGGPQA